MSCTSGFVDDVMFSHNAQSKTTPMFSPIRQLAALVRCQTRLFGRIRWVAAPEAKSAVSDCISFSFFIFMNEVLVMFLCSF